MVENTREEKLVPTYCLQCLAGGPDLLKVRVVNGVAVGIEPNFDFAEIHPAKGKVCVKAYGLIQKNYNPYRIKGPMKRTNPRKGVDEDPKWAEVSWEEALDIFAQKLLEVRKKGLVDENGYPRVAFTAGSAGTPPAYHGTLPVIFRGDSFQGSPGIWGPVDGTLGGGGGVKCNHTEHLLGEQWHKSFICAADTPLCKYIIAFGKNDSATSGSVGVMRHAEARVKGLKRVQIEPHLSVTGANADEWIPIKPETDHAFLYAMLNTVLNEMDWHKVCDIQFLKTMTNSPYLVAPNGYYLRGKDTKKPLIWDPTDNKAKTFDALEAKDFAIEGEYTASGISIGPDGKIEELVNVAVQPSFQLLIEHMKGFTPEWASAICDVSADTIRRITREFVENALVGATIKVEGVEIPYRPATIGLGKTINNGWGSQQCVWAKHVLEMLVGAIEVAGSDLGCYVLFSGPVAKTDDGFFEYPFNPTDKERWAFLSGRRDAVPTLCPTCASFHGPMHLVWRWLLEPPENWPKPSIPDVFITYKVNPMISQFDTPAVIEVLKRIPFHVAFVYTMDETAWFADLLLPEDSDLESLQIFPTGGTKERENFWEYIGFAIKQPVVKRAFNTMDITDITTELADKLGMLADYNEALNRGSFVGRKLKGTPYELKPDEKYIAEELYDRFCKVTTIGKETHDLEWFKQHGGLFEPFSKIGEGILRGKFYVRPWYLYPLMRERGMRFELPYQERLKRIGEELRARLYEKGIHWWDRQLDEYQALPKWEDVSEYLDEVTIKRFGKKPEDYPLWLLATKSTQYSWSGNVGIPLMHEVAGHVLGHTGIQMNRKTAESLGIKDGDEIWIESPYGKMKGRAKLREGVRPDCVLTTSMYGQWATPFAKDLGIPNLNQIAPALIELTDESGGSKDHVKVRVYRA